MKKDYKKFYFRLSGKEGAEFKDFKVTAFGKDPKKLREIEDPVPLKYTVHFITVKVVGLIDERASIRDW